MTEENKDLKDTGSDLSPKVKDIKSPVSYARYTKLITALFMVTDILDKADPLKNRFRTLGVEVISDIYSSPLQVDSKIAEILSLLDIALAINLISEMNFSILTKEFLKLRESIQEYNKIKSVWLEEFLPESTPVEKSLATRNNFLNGQSSRTRQASTRIGVQKGSTLMKALGGVRVGVSDRDISRSEKGAGTYDALKRKRREDIISILKTSEKGFTITDIKTEAQGLTDQLQVLTYCSEKTLQRELISMVKDGVLKKEGEKRWSRYFVS